MAGDMPEQTDVPSSTVAYPDLYEASIAELQTCLEKGLFTSVDLVKAYLARIDEVNVKGPALHAIIENNPSALSQAAGLDIEREIKGSRGPLHGIPILLKDNIATLHSEGMNTTSGSHALVGSVVPRDAFIAAKLRAAGAILLGKANQSEWANFRGQVPSGFSGRGGQATCPYYPHVDPSGSSSGSGVAMAVGLAAGSLGTETDGSIIGPCSKNNLVGIKPTVGLTSRAGVIPISSHQDSAGPMCRSVADVAAILSAIAGPDPLDEVTLSQPSLIPDYLQALNPNALRGVRLGVPRLFQEEDSDEHILAAFEASLDVLRTLGAEIIDPAEFPDAEELQASKSESIVLSIDFKIDLNKYLAGLVEVPTGVNSIADLITFNKEHADLELIPPYYEDQSQLITSEATVVDETYHAALAKNLELGRTRGIDATLEKFQLDAIIIQSNGFASTPAAIAGYPIITVPLGFYPSNMVVVPSTPAPVFNKGPGVPFGLSFLGTAYTEFQLISYAYAYEQATHVRLKQLAYPAAIPKTQLVDIVGK